MTQKLGLEQNDREEFEDLARKFGAGSFGSDFDWVIRTARKLGIALYDPEEPNHVDNVADLAGLVWFEKAFDAIMDEDDPDCVDIYYLTEDEFVDPFELGAWAEKSGFDVVGLARQYREDMDSAIWEISNDITQQHGRVIADKLCRVFG